MGNLIESIIKNKKIKEIILGYSIKSKVIKIKKKNKEQRKARKRNRK